ncbi:hypothetical protein C6569_18490 [Phreatobacter cathodiphilus]|uniref:Uncharacterized protein n=1 Tax=Phreatobacter cathodiphilus TaxID=1868589 RepID=A0A2S0NFS3_9HYPH|nr:hypothetical protein C6569_18490 [Phreatobacter cathodiphilus]
MTSVTLSRTLVLETESTFWPVPSLSAMAGLVRAIEVEVRESSCVDKPFGQSAGTPLPGGERSTSAARRVRGT